MCEPSRWIHVEVDEVARRLHFLISTLTTPTAKRRFSATNTPSTRWTTSSVRRTEPAEDGAAASIVSQWRDQRETTAVIACPIRCTMRILTKSVRTEVHLSLLTSGIGHTNNRPQINATSHIINFSIHRSIIETTMTRPIAIINNSTHITNPTSISSPISCTDTTTRTKMTSMCIQLGTTNAASDLVSME